MGKTALQLITRACYIAKLPPPSALVSATDSSTLQLTELFYDTGRELLESRWWPQLKKRHTIRLETGRGEYPLPLDFYAAIPDTQYELNNNWQLNGGMSDGEWNMRKFGYVTVENRKAFRVFGPDINSNSGGGQFSIDPVPGDGDQGVVLSFEYLSKSWLTPPVWVPSASVTSGNYRSCYGNNYTAGSTTTTGTVPPNLKNKVGRDGGVEWLALPTISAWAGTTVYPAGQYVTKGGQLYLCTVGGTSGATGPVGTTANASEADGTVTWQNKAFDSSWTGQTAYAENDHLFVTPRYYKCVTAGKTGGVTPTWTETTVSDGGVTWTEVTAAYEDLITDNDLCLFDDDLMISGLVWRFLRAQGTGYQDLLGEYNRKRQSAVARYMPGMRFNWAGLDFNESERIFLSNIGTAN